MASTGLATPAASLAAPLRMRYGVGMRVLTDRRLLSQIRSEIARNVMSLEEIAVLENVTPEALIALLEEGLGTAEDCGTPLRHFAAATEGFEVLAWRNTRKHPSKLHILDANGVVLCGTPRGPERVPIHAGACLTCAARAGLQAAALPRAA
jgi:hypothetical protein